ncbi:hypothetical protein DF185_23365 [Marinifilum breve]|uniref:Uncharacterized protein n=1 Tax=Marinifilum breve TaxID=2184082 RepID=A0A2V3ZIT2_9BACT|nr:hypothetical protein DF185_23365 [Marinifilum breve]
MQFIRQKMALPHTFPHRKKVAAIAAITASSHPLDRCSAPKIAGPLFEIAWGVSANRPQI